MSDSEQTRLGQSSKARILGPLCLLGMVAIFFGPFLLTGKTFLLRDLWFLFYPGYVFYRESLLQGHLPLWNHYFACGEPFLADAERGVLYPLNLIYLVMPAGQAMTLLSAIHILLAGAGTYALSRVWRLSVPASLLAAVGYAFSTATMTRIEFPSFLTGVAWYPVVVAAYARWLDLRTRRSLLWAMLAVFMQCMGCYPEAILFTVVSLGLYAIVSAACAWKAQQGPRSIASPLIGLAACLALGMALAAVQLLPMREATNNSPKGEGVSPDLINRMPAVSPTMLTGFLLPSVHGVQGCHGEYWAPSCAEFWQGTGYLGFMPWVIFIAVLLAWFGGGRASLSPPGQAVGPIDARLLFLLVQLAVFLLYAMGKYSPLYNGLWHLISMVRKLWCPPKCMMCVVLALSCLSGMGLDALIANASRISQGWRRWTMLGLMLSVCALAAACLLDHGRLGESLLRQAFNLNSVEPSMAHRIPWAIVTRDVIKLAAVALAGGVILTFGLAHPRARTAGAWLLVLVSFIDLAVTDRSLFPAVRPDVLERPSPMKQRLQPEPGPVRFYAREASIYLYGQTSPELFRTIRDTLLWSWPAVDHAFAVGSATIFEVADIVYMRALTSDARLPAAVRRRLLSLFNCRIYVQLPDMNKYLTSGVVDSPRLVDLGETLPRAYVVGTAEVFNETRGVYERLLDPAWEPRATALVERQYLKGESLAGLQAGPVGHRVTDIRYLPNAVELKVRCDRDAMLVLSDTYYDGWVADVNGRAAPVLKVNGAFRGVRVRAGENVVRIDYRPAPLRVGAILSLAACVVLLGVVVVPLRWLTRISVVEPLG